MKLANIQQEAQELIHTCKTNDEINKLLDGFLATIGDAAWYTDTMKPLWKRRERHWRHHNLLLHRRNRNV